MTTTTQNYTEIDRPYSAVLSRSEVGDTGALGGSMGNVEEAAVKSNAAMSDVWISNSIRSQNWKPKKVGFYINGQTGYAEFSNVYVTGGIVVSQIDLPDQVQEESFHVDADGNTWWGSSLADGYGVAPASILNTGAATFSSVSITGGTIGAGVVLAAGSDHQIQYNAGGGILGASSNFWFDPQLGGSFYARASENELGGELITNGNFLVGSTGWTLQTGWTYAANKVTFTS